MCFSSVPIVENNKINILERVKILLVSMHSWVATNILDKS